MTRLPLACLLVAASACSDASPGLVCTSGGACEETFPISSAAHVTDPVYTDIPPAGGPHLGCWAEYTAYDHAIPAGNWVHNLEHGAVVLVYACPSGCDAAVATMTAFQSSHDRVVVAPYPDLGDGFAFLSWGHRLVAPDFDAEAMAAFYAAHHDRAPESTSAPPPSACPAL